MRIILFPMMGFVMITAGLRAHALETDQYLLWGTELEDSAGVINAFLNSEVVVFIEKANAHPGRYATAKKVALGYSRHLFRNLLFARTKKWVRESEDVDRFPDYSVTANEYVKMSIYRDPAFPFYLRLGRTIRVGDVYFGIDKFGHFLGFGRRYFKNYLRLIEAGYSEEDAMERTIRWGITHEQDFVGLAIDGILSYADLEANFQGFQLLRDLSLGDNPNLINEGGQWRLRHTIDLREYVTPDFDESYNTNSYRGLRKRFVLQIYSEEYCAKASLPEVQSRFERYRRYMPSCSKRIIEAHLDERRKNVQHLHSLDVICSESQNAPPMRSAREH